MSLYESWLSEAYDQNGASVKRVWDDYMPREQRIYEGLLAARDGRVCGTIAELAARYDMTEDYIIGFLDGVKEALSDEAAMPELKEADADTAIDVTADFEKLFKRMVEYKAEHLYTLPQWDNIYTPERQKELFTEQRRSTTIVRETAKVGRNDPCPCGSGKKYKHCCGKTV